MEKTVFNKKEIKNILNEKYNISVLGTLKLRKGSANIYLILAKDKKYILKEFQSKFTPQNVESEYNFLKSLEDINTYDYLITTDNQCFFVYREKVCVLMEYIKGRTYKNNSLSLKQLEKVAYNHSILTRALNKNQVIENFDTFLQWRDIDKNRQFMRNFLKKEITNATDKKIKDDYIEKLKIIESINIRSCLETLNDSINCISCHGDYSIQQLIFNRDKITILDFITYRKLPISWEIIRSYSYADKDCKDGKININNLIAYLKVFTQNFPLSKQDIEYMPLIYLLQLLSSNYGYKQYIADNTQKKLLEFGIFRTNLCLDIFNNLENYKNDLLASFNY